jgi:hypothetical protein
MGKDRGVVYAVIQFIVRYIRLPGLLRICGEVVLVLALILYGADALGV